MDRRQSKEATGGRLYQFLGWEDEDLNILSAVI